MPFDVNKRNPQAMRSVNPGAANAFDVDEWKRQMMKGEQLPMLNPKPIVESTQMEQTPKTGGNDAIPVSLPVRKRGIVDFGPR